MSEIQKPKKKNLGKKKFKKFRKNYKQRNDFDCFL